MAKRHVLHWISYKTESGTLYTLFTYMIPCLSSTEALLHSVHETEMERNFLWLTRSAEPHELQVKSTEWIKVPFSRRALLEKTVGTNKTQEKAESEDWAGILLSEQEKPTEKFEEDRGKNLWINLHCHCGVCPLVGTWIIVLLPSKAMMKPLFMQWCRVWSCMAIYGSKCKSINPSSLGEARDTFMAQRHSVSGNWKREIWLSPSHKVHPWQSWEESRKL